MRPPGWIPGSSRACRGHALVQAAKDADAQMVVLSARGDGAVSRLLGTVSQHVLRNAPCPVPVVPAGA